MKSTEGAIIRERVHRGEKAEAATNSGKQTVKEISKNGGKSCPIYIAENQLHVEPPSESKATNTIVYSASSTILLDALP